MIPDNDLITSSLQAQNISSTSGLTLLSSGCLSKCCSLAWRHSGTAKLCKVSEYGDWVFLIYSPLVETPSKFSKAKSVHSAFLHKPFLWETQNNQATWAEPLSPGSITFSFPQEYIPQENHTLKVTDIAIHISFSSMFRGDEMAQVFYLFFKL